MIGIIECNNNAYQIKAVLNDTYPHRNARKASYGYAMYKNNYNKLWYLYLSVKAYASYRVSVSLDRNQQGFTYWRCIITGRDGGSKTGDHGNHAWLPWIQLSMVEDRKVDLFLEILLTWQEETEAGSFGPSSLNIENQL